MSFGFTIILLLNSLDFEIVQIQLSEREQEREEYETKIKYLNEVLERKNINTVENDDASLKNYIQDLELKSKEMEIVLQERTDRLNKLSIVNEEFERTLNSIEMKESENVNKLLDIFQIFTISKHFNNE